MRDGLSVATALCVLVLGGCGDAGAPNSGINPIGAGGGGGGGAAVGSSGSGGSAGSTTASGSSGSGGAKAAAGSGGSISSMTAGASATSGSGSSGIEAGGAGGMTAGAGAGGAAGAAGAPSTPGVPRIPEPKGECPMFMTGTATIGGLRVRIEAGTPKGETKGSLLFAWHFTAGTAGAAMTGVPSSVRNEITMGGGIVVAPQGNVAGSGRTDIAPPTAAWFIQDLDVADQIVACAVKNHNIDPNRIYSTGCSAGGLMSGTFGLMRSEYVAAVAPNSGGINYMASRKLSDTSHGPASFCMHGGAGDNVIVNFGNTSTWFEAQNRLAANKPFMINCNHGLGHCGAPTSLHELAWEFMKAHPYNVGTSPWATMKPDLPSYCQDVTAAPPAMP